MRLLTRRAFLKCSAREKTFKGATAWSGFQKSVVKPEPNQLLTKTRLLGQSQTKVKPKAKYLPDFFRYSVENCSRKKKNRHEGLV